MRYVIHHHETEPSHYDLMLEVEDTLETWQLKPEDLDYLIAGRRVSARRIQDHRKEYLTYEGPVSCDRGRVQLIDTGEYRLMKENRKSREYFFSGEKLMGTVVFTREGEAWRLEYTRAACL